MAFKHKVIVHVGLPKCGSSSLQEFLFDNRGLLKQWKVYCPVICPCRLGTVLRVLIAEPHGKACTHTNRVIFVDTDATTTCWDDVRLHRGRSDGERL